MEMTILGEDEQTRKLALVGRLDIEGAQRMQFKLPAQAADDKHLLIDMTGVSFIASLGMSVLVDAARTLKRHRRRLVLIGCQSLVEQALRTARLDSVMVLTPDMPTALASVAG